MPPESPAETLTREFASRLELVEYLRARFPEVSAVDDSVSPVSGGRRAAEESIKAMDPARYAVTRNYLDGAVTRLSPYIRHGVLTLAEVWRQAGGQRGKFAMELAWRDYWQRLYYALGAGVWQDQEAYKTGWRPEDYSDELPADLGASGLACIDAFVSELKTTGYLHNHARLWFAAYLTHWRRVKWQVGARFFLTHLLDGDPASNNLSWQWVASTFSQKPYFFNRDNLEHYTASVFCETCSQRHCCPFEGPYEDISKRLFRL